jgi:putative two-component system response regulator
MALESMEHLHRLLESAASAVVGRDGGEPAVLVIDDDDRIGTLLSRILTLNGYQCAIVTSVAAARRHLEASPVDLVLCDLMMHDETGMSLLGHIRSQHPGLPVVMVSGVTDLRVAALALDRGAYGYLIKPFDEQQVVIAVETAVRRARLEAENAQYRAQLELMVHDRTAALAEAVERLERSEADAKAASEETIWVLTRAIEGRDIETGQHIERMSRYASLLAEHYGLDTDHCELIRLASPMHDVGKIGVPDGILFKPGTLSKGEYDVIKEHPELGNEILGKSAQPLLVMAAVIALTHHERWDGGGYPHGLAGLHIPLEGRIASVADVFDALLSRRVYKPAFPLEQALQIMKDGRGAQFDADIVELLFAHIEEAVAIQEQYPDVVVPLGHA